MRLLLQSFSPSSWVALAAWWNCSKQLRHRAAPCHGSTPAGRPYSGGYMVATFLGRRRSGDYIPTLRSQ